MIERMLRHGLRARLGDAAACFDVSSAGPGQFGYTEMHPNTATVLGERGIDATEFVPRELTAALLEPADLVITASREHRATAVTMRPRLSVRTFTVREFGRLVGAIDHDTSFPAEPVARARGIVAAAGENRGFARPDKPGDDDLPDPIGRPMDDYQHTAQ